MMRRILLLSAVISWASPTYAQSNHVYAVPYTSELIAIDGHQGLPWNHASWSTYFTDIVTGESAQHNTNFKALWDDENLYFYFRLLGGDLEASGNVDHEPLFSFDNVIEIFLDPGADQKEYYELQINTKGTRWELLLDKPYKDGGVATSPYELEGLEYDIYLEGTLNQSEDSDKYWTVELKIPWNSIPGVTSVPPADNFKVNFSRVHQDDDDIETPPQYWLWTPMGKFDIHIPERWGSLIFIKK